MTYTSIGAPDTAAKIGPDGKATYIDVRTVAEFAAGRPKGRAINVPIEFTHPTTKEIHANTAFELVMQHTLDPATPLIVGADDGPRAAQAAEALAVAGFTDIAVLADGLPGWQTAGLPVTKDNRDGVSYVSLLTPARRAKK
ncbi:MAG: rhodanese-like domain-containing protein [Rhodospirillales bacterium]|nr:rhodanese-like domain-containing protein [Rhodospirillales bacterium]